MVMKMAQRVKSEVVHDERAAESKINNYVSKGELMARIGDSIDDEKLLIKTPDGNLYIISSKSVGWRITIDKVTMDEAEEYWWDAVYTEEAKERLEHSEEFLPSKGFGIPESWYKPRPITERPRLTIRSAREPRESDVVPMLAKKYMREGYSRSEAFRKAWEEYRRIKSR